jgi:hypothetical protein
MNKWIVALLLILVLAVIYLVLPKEIYIEQRAKIKVNSSSAYRFLANQSEWNKWWPDSIQTGSKAPSLEKYTYSLQQNYFQSLVIDIISNNGNTSSTLSLIPLGVDYTVFEWKAVVQGSAFQKVQTYLKAKKIQGSLEELLENLKDYMEKEENVYGFKVNFSKVKDTTLVTTRFTTQAYPETNEIYQYISILKAYIKAQGATETNYPMLHVQQLDSSRFESMVAIPTDRELKEKDGISFKRMVRGNILEAEVRGGVLTARRAMEQLDHYKNDHQLASPAIPFMSLVTDRSKETDTTKWITRIYYPVF